MTDDRPPEARQFDLWLGDWDVTDPDGTLVGRNRVTSLFDGRALREAWAGVSGLRGTSLNAFDVERGVWHQTWVDSSGALLLLEGGFQDGAMVLEGRSGGVRHRITWSQIESDRHRVRQHWETSPDGTTCETAFDGRYR